MIWGHSNWTRTAVSILLLIITSLLPACQKKSSLSVTEQLVGDRIAPSEIAESLKKESHLDKNLLSIQKSSLGKAFLMISSLKTSSRDSQWMDYAPTLVSFERSGGKIALFELVPKIYSVVEPEHLISSFKIVSETDDTITFDFDLGLNFIPQRSPFENPGDPLELKDLEMQGHSPSFHIKDSFIRSITNKNNSLIIEQFYRVTEQNILLLKEMEKKTEDQEAKEAPVLISTDTSYLANIQIQPYRANEKFIPQEHPLERILGFFTFGKQTEASHEVKQQILHWDVDSTQEPILVEISKDVPSHLKTAVIEGVEYWNRALNKQILKVVTDVNTSNIPTKTRTITLRWIPYDDAGYAYASLQADPLTGEILRGQIYLTSTFQKMVEGQGSASKSHSRTKTRNQIVFKGLRNFEACRISKSDNLKMFEWVLDPAIRSELGNDIVRNVVAHEMGHIMGLRHHFAATYASEVDTDSLNKAISDYTQNIANPGLATATSVMDYPDEKSDALLGRFIKHTALIYDQLSLNWARTGKVDDQLFNMPYCSDEEVVLGELSDLQVFGCSRRDGGNDPINHYFIELDSKIIDSIHYQFKTFLTKAFPKGSSANAQTFETALSEFEKSYMFYMGETDQFKNYLLVNENAQVKTILIKTIQSTFWGNDWFDWFNLDIKSSVYDYESFIKNEFKSVDLNAQLQKVLMMNSNRQFTDRSEVLSEKFIQNFVVQNGETPEGVSYSLPEESIKKIKLAAQKALKSSAQNLIRDIVSKILPDEKEKFISPFPNLESADAFLSTVSAAILLRQDLPVLADKQSKWKPAQYASGTRESLANILNSKRWSNFELSQPLSRHKDYVQKTLRKEILTLLELDELSSLALNASDLSLKVDAAFYAGKVTHEDYIIIKEDLTLLKALEVQ